MSRHLFIRRQNKSNPLRFYIYAYIRTKDSSSGKVGTPYYIGKGCGKRAWVKRGRKSLPQKTHIIIVSHSLTEIGAFALERRLISWYGRINDNTGILRNLTDGGEGGSGRVVSESEKSKIRNRVTGTVNARDSITGKSLGNIRVTNPKYISGEYISANRGSYTWTDENHPRGMLGKTQSDEFKIRLQTTMLGEGNPMYGKKQPTLSIRNSDPTFIAENSLRQKERLTTKKALDAGYSSYKELCDVANNLLLEGQNVFDITGRYVYGSRLTYLGQQLKLSKRQTELLFQDIGKLDIIRQQVTSN